MSVLVKGMKFPENCGECPFDNGIYCTIYPKSESMVYDANDSLDWCPLVRVPDHGVVIGADVVRNLCNELLNGIKEAT